MKNKSFNEAVILMYQAFLELDESDLDDATESDLDLLDALKNHEAVIVYKSETTKA